MNILVTGGTGYLGRHLIKRFIEARHSVMCVGKTTGKAVDLQSDFKDVLLLHSEDENMESKILDFAPDTIVNLACKYELEGVSPASILDANLIFPFRIMQYALRTDTKLWINAGSSLPINLNSYSLSKCQFSQWGEYYSDRSKLTFLNLKLESFYGINQPPTHFLGWVIRDLISGKPLNLTIGTQKKDFIFIEDVEDVFCSLLSRPLTGYWDIPVGTGNAPVLRDVIEYLHIITHSESKLNFGAIPQRNNEPSGACDTSILKQFGLECTCFWKTGMKKCFGESEE